ncbi:MAG: hypothetical protein HQL64_05630 [Magnetococcales bacterium]|nr:hypothetical protein [Magnetococcales bacterium]
MKNSHIEWKMLTGSMVLLLLSVLVDIGVILAGLQYSSDAVDNMDKLNKTIATLQGQKRRQEEQNQLLVVMKPKHEELLRRGVVGQEPRMSWVEAIKEAEQVLRLPSSILFKLEPARLISPPPVPLAGNDLQLFASHMEITLGLAHEGDLFDFIAFLEKKNVGLFHFKKCKLQAVTNDGQTGQTPRIGVNLQGVCHLEWFTFREAHGKAK